MKYPICFLFLFIAQFSTAQPKSLLTLKGNIVFHTQTEDGKFLFVQDIDDNHYNNDIWLSDGTKNGTSLISNQKGYVDYYGRGMSYSHGYFVYFNKTDHIIYKVSISSGTTSAILSNVDSYTQKVKIGNRWLFSITEIAGTSKLYSTNEDFDDVQLIYSGLNVIDYFVLRKDQQIAYFKTQTGASPNLSVAFWRTDGTQQGTFTAQLLDLPIAPSYTSLTSSYSNQFIVFDQNKIWSWDGTSTPVQSFASTYAHYTSSFLDTKGKFYFYASDSLNHKSIWVTDGTKLGTEVTGISPDFQWRIYSRIGDSLIMSGDDIANNKSGVWAITPSNNLQLIATWQDVDNAHVCSSGMGSSLVRLGNKLLIDGHSNKTGQELYIYDSTISHTFQLKDIAKGYGSGLKEIYESYFRGFYTTPHFAYFQADEGVFGRELWRTDGTSEGTRIVADILSGAASSNPRVLDNIGNLLFFQTQYVSTGNELYVWDETESLPTFPPYHPNYEWLRTMGSANCYYTYPNITNTDLKIDKDNNIYTTANRDQSLGYAFYGDSSFSHPKYYNEKLIAKRNKDGKLLWVRDIGQVKQWFNQPTQDLTIALDNNGDVFAVGTLYDTAYVDTLPLVWSKGRVYMAKLSSNSGELLWVKQIPASCEIAKSLTDKQNNLYVAGTYNVEINLGTIRLKASNNNPANFIAKYDPNGNLIWARNIENSAIGYGKINEFMVDSNDNIYLLASATQPKGTTAYKTEPMEMQLVSLTSDGKTIWEKNFWADYFGQGIVAAISPDGKIYIVGRYRNKIHFDDKILTTDYDKWKSFFVKIDAQGKVLSAENCKGHSFYPHQIVFDKVGTYYIVGMEYWSAEQAEPRPGFAFLEGDRIAITRYLSTDALLERRELWRGGDASDDYDRYAPQIAIDSEGFVVLQDRTNGVVDSLSFSYYSQINAQSIFLLKFAMNPLVPIAPDGSLSPSSVHLFPNPATYEAALFSDDGDFLTSDIHIYNVLGQSFPVKVKNYDFGYRVLDISDLCTGIYFVSLQKGGKMFTEKLVKQ